MEIFSQLESLHHQYDPQELRRGASLRRIRLPVFGIFGSFACRVGVEFFGQAVSAWGGPFACQKIQDQIGRKSFEGRFFLRLSHLAPAFVIGDWLISSFRLILSLTVWSTF